MTNPWRKVHRFSKILRTCRQRIAAIPVDFRGLEQREHVRNVQARHRCAPGKPFVGGDQVVGLDALGGGEHRAVQYSAASSAAASCTIRTASPRDRRRSAKKRSQMREPSSAAFILRRRSAYAASPSEARMRRARRARPTARLRR